MSYRKVQARAVVVTTGAGGGVLLQSKEVVGGRVVQPQGFAALVSIAYVVPSLLHSQYPRLSAIAAHVLSGSALCWHVTAAAAAEVTVVAAEVAVERTNDLPDHVER